MFKKVLHLKNIPGRTDCYRPLVLAGIIFLCFSIMPDRTQAQSRISHSPLVIDNWGIEDGLPVNNALRVLQSGDGYLWIVTFDGLVRFDGLQFKVFQTIEYPGLPTNRLTNIHEARDGSLWIETEQDFLIRYKDMEFIHIDESHGLNGRLVTDMTRDCSGNIWITTERGISIYDGEMLTAFEPERISGDISRLFVQKNGAVWFINNSTHRIYRYYNDSYDHVVTTNGPYQFYPFYEENDNDLWFATDDDIYTFRDEKLEYCCTKNDFLNEDLSDHPDFLNISLPQYANGYYSFDIDVGRHFLPGKSEIYTIKAANFKDDELKEWRFTQSKIYYQNQLALKLEQGFNSYTFDHEGNLWIGSRNKGLFRLKPNPFQTWSTEEGLPERNIYPVLEDREGTIWVGTFGEGLGMIKNGEVEQAPRFASDEDAVYSQSLLELSDGTILAGVINDGYYQLRPGDAIFTKPDEPEEIKGATVSAMHQQANGSLWLGTNFGLFKKEYNEWLKFDQSNGFSNFTARFFLDAPDGTLWMATNGGGIVSYRNGTFHHFNREQGFASNLVRSLFIEPDSNPDNYILWAGSEDQGLFRIEVENSYPIPETITRYGIADGLLDFVIHIILMDDDGNFWFNTNRGIFTVPKSGLEAFHRKETDRVKGISYTENDGLRNREGNGGMQPAGIRAADGTLWLASQDGVTRFDPSGLVTNQIVPPVIIHEFITNRQTITQLNREPVITLTRGERDFEFRFTSLSFIEPDKNEFRYRLVGYNDDWIEAERRRSAIYTNIPAGDYRFEVMGTNNAGIWNPEPAVIYFEIAPYLYETAWFRLLILVLAGCLIYGGFRWRLHSLERSEKILKKKVEIRTRELQNEKKKTELQAEKLKQLDLAKTRFFTNISHEIRTPLTLIINPLQRMLSQGPDTHDNNTITELERMMRNSKRLLRLIDQTLELTLLEKKKLKLQIQKIDIAAFCRDLTDLFIPLCIEKNIDLSFVANSGTGHIYADPDKLDKIIGNLLSNAVKFTPAGGSITVEISETNETLTIAVTDTGIGISPEKQGKIFDRFYQVDSSETRIHEGSGIGLSLAYELAAFHHGELSVESEPDKGTRMNLKLKKGDAHFSADELRTPPPVSDFVNARHVNDSAINKGESPPPVSDDKTSVLIVEDNYDVRTFIKEELSGTYTTFEASNGHEALHLVSEQLPDLIIADIMMPKMDGLTFNNELKKDPLTASIPLIFLTAKASLKNKLEGLQNGADDYITKPFDPSLLMARVNNLIESRHRLRKILLGKTGEQTKSKNGNHPSNSFMQKIDDVIELNYSDPDFSVTELAENINLNRSHLYKKLKKDTGLSPMEYIKQYRMEQATKLIAANAGNISEVAYAVGFKSLSYFSSSFKNFHGYSPSEYANNLSRPTETAT